MTTCANCKADAIYSYLSISYCNKHLPRFLRDRYGKPNHLVSLSIVEAPRATPVPSSMIPTVLEPIVEPEVVVEDVVEEAPKKKASTKAE